MQKVKSPWLTSWSFLPQINIISLGPITLPLVFPQIYPSIWWKITKLNLLTILSCLMSLEVFHIACRTAWQSVMETLSRICFFNTVLQLDVYHRTALLRFPACVFFSPFYWYKTTKISSLKASDSFPPKKASSLFPLSFLWISSKSVKFLFAHYPELWSSSTYTIFFPTHDRRLSPTQCYPAAKGHLDYLCWTSTNLKIVSTNSISVFTL